MLKSPATCFFTVTLPDPTKVQEVLEVVVGLRKQGIRSVNMVINRAYPDWLDFDKKFTDFSEQDKSLQNYYDKLFNYYHNQIGSTKEQVQKIDQNMGVYFVAERMLEMQTSNLQSVSKNLLKGFQ